MKAGRGRRYLVRAGDVTARLMLYPSGRCEIQVWRYLEPGLVLGVDLNRTQASQQLRKWREIGAPIEEPRD